MGKNELKKQIKRSDLLNSAYDLFTKIGFNATTIRAIAIKAGVGKGTFYLYFDSKEHIRNELIMQRSSEVLKTAMEAMREKVQSSEDKVTVSERIIFIVDYILEYLQHDRSLLNFIAKNLSWGLLFNSEKPSHANDEVIDFKSLVLDNFNKDGIVLKEPALLFFTIIELISSTCYSVILNEEPVSFETYKPYLHNAIKLLVDDAVIEDVK